MKLITFKAEGHVRLGYHYEDRVYDITKMCGTSDMSALIRDWDSLRSRINRIGVSSFKFDELEVLSPIRSSSILCAGSNYKKHNQEKANAQTSGTEPEFFVKTIDCLVGPFDSIPYDEKLTKKLDAETELAIVIGKTGRHIDVKDALAHIFGYTVANDVTARDKQVRSRNGFVWYELGRGKVFDGSLVLGPCIVTSDEIGDPQTLTLSTVINGEQRQLSSTSEMIWSCAQLVSSFSENLTLKPGMVILTGTPAGTAWSFDKELGGKALAVDGLVPADRYLLPGDHIESYISGIGKLSNQVVDVEYNFV